MSLADPRRWILAAAASIGSLVGQAGAGEPVGVGLIEINETPTERPGVMSDLLGMKSHESLRSLVDILRVAAADADLKAVVVRIRDAELGNTQVEELGRAMDAVRAAGKKVHVFSDAYSTAELRLGAHADEVILQAGGAISFPGLYSEEMYLADTLNWAGIKPDFVQVGDYKGASEPMARSSPSPQWEQNISRLLDSLYANIRGTVKQGRKLSDEQLDEAMRQAVFADGDMAKRVGLIDATVDLPELNNHLRQNYGGEVAWSNLTESDEERGLDISNPFSLISKLMKPASTTPKRETIAVLHIDGPIVDGESEGAGLFGGSSVGSITIRRAIQEIEDHSRIKGVIVRINSPGGSAVASEIIWQGLRRLSKTKPVWVSVGSMAASGGYYIAVAGDKIYVNPSSIVGSIGVVGGKLAMGGLYEKIKLNVVSRSRGPMGAVFGSTVPWTESERAFIRQRMTDTYNLFTRRVSAGRQGIVLADTAEGRLFTGNIAVTNKMADEVGGLNDAITALASLQGLKDGGYDVMDFPPEPSIAEMLGGLFGSMASAVPPDDDDNTASIPAHAAVGLLREVVGTDAWPMVRDNLSALLQLRRERVLLVSPRVLIVR
ncbi:MAG: S49 family peptidase [Phycisphaerales bacterium]|nr:S49 family peptidase [Phycisphaerales bacterium]